MDLPCVDHKLRTSRDIDVRIVRFRWILLVLGINVEAHLLLHRIVVHHLIPHADRDRHWNLGL